jgi:hypothetical protein
MFGVVFPNRSFPMDISTFAQIDTFHWILDMNTFVGKLIFLTFTTQAHISIFHSQLTALLYLTPQVKHTIKSPKSASSFSTISLSHQTKHSPSTSNHLVHRSYSAAPSLFPVLLLFYHFYGRRLVLVMYNRN